MQRHATLPGGRIMPDDRCMLSLIVAMSANARVIGRAGGLPWHLSADLKRFKQLTMGHHLIMGRKTYDSIGRALPGRTSIIVSRHTRPTAWPDDLILASSLADAQAIAKDDTEAFVIGGGEIFQAALPLAQKAYVTWVDAALPGDTFFPEFPTPAWKLIAEEYIPQDAKNEFATRYSVYERQT
jgi:dihydrofolate reductase